VLGDILGEWFRGRNGDLKERAVTERSFDLPLEACGLLVARGVAEIKV